MNFFFWYFTTGILSVTQIAGNYVRSVLHHYNLAGLLRTLFSSWKRDISFIPKGLHPVIWAEALMNNIVTRLLGAIVRMGVILWGLGVLLFIGMVVVVVAAFALVAPFILLGGAFVIGQFLGVMAGVAAFIIAMIVMMVQVLAWQRDSRKHVDYGLHPELAPWRDRALLRLGIPPKSIDPETLASAEKRAAYFAVNRILPEQVVVAWNIEGRSYARREMKRRFWDWENLKRDSRIGKYWSYAYTPHLDHYVSDLSESDFSTYRDQEWIGRENVWDMLVLTLSRPTDNSALLVGPPGIGKRSLVHALARQIRENHFTERVIDESRILVLDMGQAMTDAQAEGIDPKGMLRSLFNEAVYAGNVVLVIENIDLFLNPESDLCVSDILNDYLAFPSCRIIGLMTPEAYQSLGRGQIPALKYFETIVVPETTKEETVDILVETFRTLEKRRPVFTVRGWQAIVDGAERYNWERPFPERAIDLAQEILLFWEKQPDVAFIDRSTVEDFLEMKSGIPMGDATEGEREKLLNLEALLHERIIGQDEAITQISEAFRKARVGLGNDKKPIGSFLFLGPTGVGKTETAKALAAVYFNDPDRMVRLDMSEFQSPQSIEELIGSAEMNVPGRMTTLIREHPYTILLLDELEKVYPRALDLFLQILDEGYVTDGFGHKVNFRNTIVIATSNAGAERIHAATAAGQSMGELKDELIETIISEGIFRPEFLNRFDGVILFNSLTPTEMERVTAQKLAVFTEKLFTEKHIRITFTPEAIRAIVERGYEREFGVRSINRYISDVVEDAIVKQLLSGTLSEGVEVTFTDQDLGE